jgi:hypothetical protein
MAVAMQYPIGYLSNGSFHFVLSYVSLYLLPIAGDGLGDEDAVDPAGKGSQLPGTNTAGPVAAAALARAADSVVGLAANQFTLF